MGMRTHSTPVKSAGHAGDGLASMRTHSTPVQSAGHAADGLASKRSHSIQVKSGSGADLSSSSLSWEAGGRPRDGPMHARAHSTQAMLQQEEGDPYFEALLHKSEGPLEDASSLSETPPDDVAGEYWLPWHIDSNFVTVL